VRALKLRVLIIVLAICVVWLKVRMRKLNEHYC